MSESQLRSPRGSSKLKKIRKNWQKTCCQIDPNRFILLTDFRDWAMSRSTHSSYSERVRRNDPMMHRLMSRSRCRSHRIGFTLIELLVVIAIIAIL
jgi:prepilin-type N-terminal cleavage/methylation domain-containing protein